MRRAVSSGRRLPLVFQLCLAAALAAAGCSTPLVDSPLRERGCTVCHHVEPDNNHAIGCVRCHGGDANASSMDEAHRGLVAAPDDPIHMERRCGPCHRDEVERAKGSLHFTLKREIGLTWRAFFQSEPPTVAELALGGESRTGREAVVVDLLARRCLRCHPYWEGDDYEMTLHGKGCGACHLTKGAGPAGTHHFSAQVNDARCLACHRYTYVGWDYYGLAPKDIMPDFDAPLYEGRHLPRPFGVLWLEMRRDLHAEAGLSCTDCHIGGPCTGEKAVSCLRCHGEGSSHPMTSERPGHRPQDVEMVSCQTCHAVWEPQDLGQELVVSMDPPFDEWLPLARQGSSELEGQVLRAMVLPEEAWGGGHMINKFSGEEKAGIWLWVPARRKRWPVSLKEVDGRLEVVRPILDICITNPGGERFCAAKRDAWLPYAPHTIGHADAFRTNWVEAWLKSHGRKEN